MSELTTVFCLSVVAIVALTINSGDKALAQQAIKALAAIIRR
jgi:hypothetical protein